MTEFIVSEVINGEPLMLRKAEDGAQNLRLDRPILLWILLTLVKCLNPLSKNQKFSFAAKRKHFCLGAVRRRMVRLEGYFCLQHSPCRPKE